MTGPVGDPFRDIAASHHARAAARTARKAKARRDPRSSFTASGRYDVWRDHQNDAPLTPPPERP